MIHKMSTEQKTTNSSYCFWKWWFWKWYWNVIDRKEGEFYIHLHNSFTDDSMVMKVDIDDFARMFNSLSEYFKREQIKIWL